MADPRKREILIPSIVVHIVLGILTCLIVFPLFYLLNVKVDLIAERIKAETLRVRAEAEASYNRTLSASIDDKVLRWKKLEKWDGEEGGR
jgi:hypothetical protein